MPGLPGLCAAFFSFLPSKRGETNNGELGEKAQLTTTASWTKLRWGEKCWKSRLVFPQESINNQTNMTTKQIFNTSHLNYDLYIFVRICEQNYCVLSKNFRLIERNVSILLIRPHLLLPRHIYVDLIGALTLTSIWTPGLINPDWINNCSCSKWTFAFCLPFPP